MPNFSYFVIFSTKIMCTIDIVSSKESIICYTLLITGIK